MPQLSSLMCTSRSAAFILVINRQRAHEIMRMFINIRSHFTIFITIDINAKLNARSFFIIASVTSVTFIFFNRHRSENISHIYNIQLYNRTTCRGKIIYIDPDIIRVHAQQTRTFLQSTDDRLWRINFIVGAILTASLHSKQRNPVSRSCKTFHQSDWRGIILQRVFCKHELRRSGRLRNFEKSFNPKNYNRRRCINKRE